MQPLNIILFNMSNYAEWLQGVNNRNYHVFSELLKSPQVGTIVSVDYLPLTFKRAVRNLKDAGTTARESSAITMERSLSHTLTKLSDRHYSYSDRSFFRNPEAAVASIIKTVQQTLSIENFIVWSFFPPVMPYLQKSGQKFTIFDAVDNWAEHPSYAYRRDRLLQEYQIIKSSADVIFTVSEDLQSLFDSKPTVYWIPNGVDVQHYQGGDSLVNRDIADLPKPIIGYIGVIQDRVDIELITFLAAKNPNKSFAIVGPVWNPADQKKLEEYSNIYLLGYKRYADAPSYIRQFDVAIIPHKRSRFISSTNPMKMYEYLACGKPVVATAGSGAELFKKFVYIAKTPDDFNKKISLALAEDTGELKIARKKAIEPYSWTAVVRQMLDIVEKKYTY